MTQLRYYWSFLFHNINLNSWYKINLKYIKQIITSFSVIFGKMKSCKLNNIFNFMCKIYMHFKKARRMCRQTEPCDCSQKSILMMRTDLINMILRILSLQIYLTALLNSLKSFLIQFCNLILNIWKLCSTTLTVDHCIKYFHFTEINNNMNSSQQIYEIKYTMWVILLIQHLWQSVKTSFRTEKII